MQTVRSVAFSTLLRCHRLAAGLTQAELAERTGISVRSLSDMERGVSRWPHRDTVALLADVLHLPPGERVVFETAARRPLARTATNARVASPFLQRLPIPPTTLIGREHDEAALAHMLSRDDVRLLTLTGPPGVGKSRLALQVASAVQPRFTQGVAFVALAAVREPDLVLASIAHALGLRETGRQSVAHTVTGALRQWQILLLLDNFEQVLDAAPVLADLLAACPEVKLLVTSRAALRVRAEHEFPVLPLAVPSVSHLPALGELSQYPAVALFVQRARAIMPTFQLTPAEAPAVAAICARLDGLPLAIELAAPYIKLFSPPALLERVANRLPLLTDGARDLPERQRTLESAISWSYGLLGERERRLFRHLAVFVGGWELAAAESVCGATSDETSTRPEGILEVLASLVDKSLVVRGESAAGEARFRMLETVRGYALAQLTASTEEEAARQRYFEYYLRLAEAAFQELRGPAQVAWLDRLEREHDNLRAALGWALARGEAERGLEMAWALYVFWRKRGHLREGQRWVEALLALTGNTPGGGVDRGTAHGMGVAMAPLPPALRARALFAVAALRLWQFDLEGIAPLEASLALFREAGDMTMTADTLHALGMLAHELGDESRAEALGEESLALSRQVGNLWSIAQASWTLGELAYARGDYERAAVLNTEGLALFRQVGDVSYVAMLTLREGYIARARGDTAGAAARYREALALVRRLEETRGTVECVEALGILLSDQGQAQRAVRLFGAAASLREAVAEPPRPTLRPALDHAIASLRTVLGDEAFATAWASGQAAALKEIIAECESASQA